MKKILAILLAGAMIVGMSATAFAQWGAAPTVFGAEVDADSSYKGLSFTANIVPRDIENTTSGAGAKGGSDSINVYDAVAAPTITSNDVVDKDGTKVIDTVSSVVRSGGGYTVTFNLYSDVPVNTEVSGDIVLTFTDSINGNYDNAGTATAYTDAELIATFSYDETVVNKTTTTTVDADDAKDITQFAKDAGLGDAVRIEGTYTSVDNIDSNDRNSDYDRIDTGKMIPIDENSIMFDLRTDMFADEDGDPINSSDEFLGQTAVRENRMSARIQVAKGSNLIDAGPTIKYDGGKAYVDIDFIDELTSVDDEGFEFTVALSIDGKRQDRNGEAAIVVGSLENIHEDVYADDDDFYMDEQDVIVAREFNEDIELYLGAGISVYTKLFKDKEYYGIAKRNDDEANDVVMAAHPDIDNIVRIYSVGLNSSGDVVGFSTDYDNYYVYDEDLNLLGMSDERVEFRSVYYLANRPLDVDVDVEPIDPDPAEDFTPPAGTGGDKAPTNANANPGTGF